MFDLVVFLALNAFLLFVSYWVLGMTIRATLGVRAQRFYNTIILLPISIVMTPVWVAAHVILEVRFYFARNKLFLGFFVADPLSEGEDKQEVVWKKLEELRLRWLEDRVNARRALVATALTAKDRRFFSGLAAQSRQELRFGCKAALASGYQAPPDLGEQMGLGVVMRIIRRVAAST